MKGSELVAALPANNVAARDAMLLGAVEAGQVVFDLVPIQLGPRLRVYVMAWPLRFGTADDCVALGTSADTQQQIADALGMRVITPLIADVCWLQADVRVSPQTQPINHSTAGYVKHSDAITAAAQQWQRDEGAPCPPRMVAGWKDWCLTRDALAKGKPTNYGWHIPDGFRWHAPAPAVTGGGLTVIQGPHEAHSGAHADYSQLIRLVHARAELDGKAVSLDDVLSGALGHSVALLAAHDGPLGASRFPWVQPVAAGAAPLPDPVRAPANGTADDPPRITDPGERGEDVHAWQLHLISQGYTLPRFGADSDHGGETEGQTLRYLADRGMTRPEPDTGPDTLPDGAPQVSFRQARKYHAGRRSGPPIWIVIHTAETIEHEGTAESLQAYAATMPDGRSASWHYAVDNDTITQSVKEEHTAWACPGCNARGIQIELAGRARQTAAEWDDAFSRAQLKLAAWLVASICLRWDIPATKLSPTDLRAGVAGICGHVDGSRAFKRSTHTDPGTNFPWDRFLDMVRAAM